MLFCQLSLCCCVISLKSVAFSKTKATMETLKARLMINQFPQEKKVSEVLQESSSNQVHSKIMTSVFDMTKVYRAIQGIHQQILPLRDALNWLNFSCNQEIHQFKFFLCSMFIVPNTHLGIMEFVLFHLNIDLRFSRFLVFINVKNSIVL